jgi:hypothetical protein
MIVFVQQRSIAVQQLLDLGKQGGAGKEGL